jgi:hypothetical protein
MVQKVVNLCDLHYSQGEEREAELPTTVITLDKRTIEIDLCADDKKELTEALEKFFAEGRRPNRAASLITPEQQRKQHRAITTTADGRPRTASGKPSQSMIQPSEDGVYYCDQADCPRSLGSGKGFDTAQGVAMHRIRSHGILKDVPHRVPPHSTRKKDPELQDA